LFYSPRHPLDLHSFPTRRSSDLAPSKFRSVTITCAPSAANLLQVALPIPPAPPVIKATFLENSASFGANDSLYNSNGQYSISNDSFSFKETKLPRTEAPCITAIARWYNSPLTFAKELDFPVLIIPTPGINITLGAVSAIMSPSFLFCSKYSSYSFLN